MFEFLLRIKGEKLAGLLFVLVLHGAVLYELWSFRIIPTPDEAVTLMVNLINPPPPPEQPKPPKPELPKPQKIAPPEPPQVQPHLVVEAPPVVPDQPVVYVPPAPPPVVLAPAPRPPEVVAPPQPLVLSGELSVSCPERSQPRYPMQSTRLNEQGRVLVQVELGVDGGVANATVKTSSGYRRLDEAALSAVRTWRCKPALRNGVAVPAVALQPFNFTLEGR